MTSADVVYSLYFPNLTYVASPKLVGFEANPFGTYPFEQLGFQL